MHIFLSKFTYLQPKCTFVHQTVQRLRSIQISFTEFFSTVTATNGACDKLEVGVTCGSERPTFHQGGIDMAGFHNKASKNWKYRYRCQNNHDNLSVKNLIYTIKGRTCILK